MIEPPRLYLIAPDRGPGAALLPQLEAALGAGDVASVLFRDGSDMVSDLIRTVQAHGAAALVADVAEAVGEADGVHLGDLSQLHSALRRLHPSRIVGVGGVLTRDDAMLAGEAGADYLMFGEPALDADAPFEERLDRIAWWAEIFQVPCVAVAHSVDEIAPLAAAGADFVALDRLVWGHPGGPAMAIGDASVALQRGFAERLVQHGESVA